MSGSDGRSFPGEPVPGYGFYLLAGTFIVVCLQVLLYLLLIGDTLGPVEFLRRQTPPDPALVRELKVALLRSEASARLFPDNPENYFLLARHWEQVLKREGMPFRVISDAQLGQGLRDANVLVLPATSCLGEPQRRVILQFLQAGNGIVASGALGARDGNCVWKGWSFLSRISGVQKFSNLTLSASAYVTFRGETFFSPGVPTDHRLEIPSQELTLGIAEEPDAFLSDWMLRPVEGHQVGGWLWRHTAVMRQAGSSGPASASCSLRRAWSTKPCWTITGAQPAVGQPNSRWQFWRIGPPAIEQQLLSPKRSKPILPVPS